MSENKFIQEGWPHPKSWLFILDDDSHFFDGKTLTIMRENGIIGEDELALIYDQKKALIIKKNKPYYFQVGKLRHAMITIK